MTFDIDMKLPSLNEYIDACRTNPHVGSKMKREVEDQIAWFFIGLPRIEKPVVITFTWVEENAKRDLDNIAFSKKFILDALVRYQKLPGDGQKWVRGFSDSFLRGNRCHVIVTIQEVDV